MLLILGGCAQTSHTPCPSREGRFGRCFLVGNERFDGMVSPLERGNFHATNYLLLIKKTNILTSPLKRLYFAVIFLFTAGKWYSKPSCPGGGEGAVLPVFLFAYLLRVAAACFVVCRLILCVWYGGCNWGCFSWLRRVSVRRMRGHRLGGTRRGGGGRAYAASGGCRCAGCA